MKRSKNHYHNKYPQVASCLDCVADLVATLREHPTMELEARFGTCHPGKFKTGVSREKMDEIIELMESCPAMTYDDQWNEIQDVFFTHKNDHLRTRIEYDSNTMSVTTTTIRKEQVRALDFKHVGRMAREDNQMDVRISLKNEVPLKPSDIPTSVQPNLVRIKQQRHFKYKAFSFDFSMTWSGKDRNAAELSQMSDDACFEIECELINPKDYLAIHDDAYVALSILLKVHDLLPDDCTIVPA
jgi:hypothetical protein